MPMISKNRVPHLKPQFSNNYKHIELDYEVISPTFQQGLQDLGPTLTGTYSDKHSTHLSPIPINAKDRK